MTDLLERSPVTRETFPEWIEPMVASVAGEPFSDEDWLFERKLDGQRCLTFIEADRVRMLTRDGEDVVDTYPEVADWWRESTCPDLVVDGEVVAFAGAASSFQQLQPRMHIHDRDEARRSPVPVYYYVFDLLHLEGVSTRDLALRERKQLLRDRVEFSDPVRFTPHRNGDGVDFFDEACADGWAGLVAKDALSLYRGSTNRSWLDFECMMRQEFVVGGYTDPGGDRSSFGALLVGYYDNDDLVYVGKVGSGYDDETLRHLGDELRKRETDKMPFTGHKPPDAHWVEPELVAEVRFSEWTSSGRLRHPRYVGLRRDKAADEVVRQTAE